MPPSQDNRAVILTTPLPPDTLVFRSLSGYERLSQTYEFRVAALATQGDIDLDALLGETCTLSLQQPGGGKRYFHGRCAQIAFVGNEQSGLVYELTLRPDLWFLSRNRNCRIFQNKTATDIVSTLLQENGIARFTLKLENGFPPNRVYCVQYMESDFAFISRLLEHEGLHYFFRHDASGVELVIADSNSAHDTIANFDDIPYYPPGDMQARERSHLDAWSLTHSAAPPASIKATDFNYDRPTPMKQVDRLDPSYTGDNADHQIHPAGYDITGDGDRIARLRLDAERALRAYAVSSGNALGLQPGCKFSLRNHPHARQNREHLVIEARLHIEADTYIAGGGRAGQRDERIDLMTIPSDTVFRPAPITPRPRIHGTQTAIVTGRSGEEIETQKDGAVKVSFHWDTYSKKDQTSSCWIRVGQLWAGGGWGGMFIPRIGMEVMVEFIDGDPDRPIITGCVYNGQNAPPYGLPGDRTRSTVKSNSSKGGGGFNEIRFEDKKGQEEIYIHAQKDQNVEILNNLSTQVGSSEQRAVGTTRDTKIGTHETRAVGVNETVSIGANQTLTVGASQTETVSLSRTLSIGAADTVSIGTARTTTIGGADIETVGAASTLTVGTAYNLTVGGAMTISVGGALSMSVGGIVSIQAGGAVNIVAPIVNVMGGLVSIKGKSVQVG